MSKSINHQLIIRACTSLASATLCATIFLTINTNNVKASAMPLPVQSNVAKNVNQINHLIQNSNLEKRNMLRNGILDNWQNVNYSYDEATKTLTIKGGTLVDPNPISYQFIAKADEIQTIKITGKLTLEGSVDSLFNNLKNLKEINGANNIDTSKVTDMLNMFYGCDKLNKVDVSNWNTSQVTNMCDMFSGCNVLDGLDVSNWNTSKVTNMSAMFEGCQKLSKIDVSKWDTSQVTHMSMMFDNCQELSKIDVSNWNTSQATDMYRMFFYCNVLNGLDVSNWNTSKVTNMSYMFYNCSKLSKVDVVNWDTSKVTNMAGMFGNCYALDGLDVSNWNTSKVTDMGFMFISCQKLSKIDVSNWNTSKVTNMDGMFYVCNALDGIDVSSWNTNQVTDMSYMFVGCQNLTKLDLSNFNDQQVDDKVLNHGHTGMLDGLSSLVELCLGPNINITKAGLNTPVEWVSVGKGTIARPAGTEYYSSNDLAKFWNNKDYTETWVPGIKHNIKINYVDLDDNNKVIQTDSISGNSIHPIDYKSSFDKIVASLKDKHYEYVASEDKLPWSNGQIQLPDDVTDNTTYTVGFKHTISNVKDGDKNPVTGGTITGLNKEIKQTIKYTGAPKSIANNVQTVKFTRGGKVDLITGKVILQDWNEGQQSFKDVDSPKVAGYVPDIATVKGVTVKPTDSDITKEVKYSRGSYNININYVDSNTGKTIKTDKVSGNPDKVISYQDQLKQILHDLPGYILDKGKTNLPLDNNNDIKLSDTVTGDKDYQVVLKHDSKTMHAGDKNPVTGKDENGLTKTITQTIKYTGAPSKITDNVQKVTFKRDADVDMVTGKLTYHDWDNKELSFKDVASPMVTGYDVNPNSIKGATVTPDSSDITKEVKYSRGSYNINIDYVDNNTDKTIKTDKVSGNPDKVISYQDQLKQILHDLPGYVIDKDKTTLPLDDNNDIKLPDSVTGDKDYQVVLKHDSKTMHAGDKNPVTGKDENGLTKTITQTIKYTGMPSTISDNVQKMTFKRDADVDMVTGKLTYHDWDNKEQSFKDVDSPKVAGYKPDIITVKGATVKPTDSDVAREVKYSRGSYNINIDYVDSNTGKTIKTDKVSGNPDNVISYQDQLKQILHDLPGYVVDKDKTTLPLDNNNNNIKLPNTVTGDKDYQIVLKHDSKTMHAGDKNPVTGKDENSLTKTITQTIKYTGAPTDISDNVQKVTFKRDADVDMVTGKLTYHDWDNKEQLFKDVDSPAVSGYTPDITTVKGSKVTADSNDIAKQVVYTKDKNDPDYEITIDYQDENGKTIKTDKQKGKANSTIPYKDRMQEIINSIAKNGYEVDWSKSNLPVDSNGNIKLGAITGNTNYKLVLKHKIVTFKYGEKNPFTGEEDPNLERKVTQTIKYLHSGKNLPNNVQTLTFTRDAQVDMITGKVAYLEWHEGKQTFKDVKSPTIQGYAADLPIVKGRTITGNSKNIVQLVTYHNSNIVQTGLDLTKNKQTTILGTIVAALASLLSYFGITKKKDKK